MQGLLAVGGQGNPSPFQCECPLDDIPAHGTVVHHQQVPPDQARSGRGRLRGNRLGRRLFCGRPPEGQLEPEVAALAKPALDPDLPAHQLHEPLADGQAQSGAAKTAADARVGLGEGGKQPLQRRGRDTDAGIPDLEAQSHGRLVGLALLDQQRHLPLFGELDGIADQVEQYLFQPQPIAPQWPQGGRRYLQTQRQSLGLGRGPHQAVEIGEQRPQVAGAWLDAQLAGLDLGQIEYIVEDGQQGLAGAADALDHVALVRGERLALQDLGQAEDGIQRGADLVAHVGEKLALGRVGGLGDRRGLAQLTLVALPLTDVTGYAKDLHADATGTEQRADRDIGPDGRSVFAALFQLSAEDVQGQSGLQVGLEPPEIVCDNGERLGDEDLLPGLSHGLIRGEAAQFLDGWAHIGKSTHQIHRPDDVDCIVGQQAVSLLADPQPFLHLPAGRDVLDHRQVARRLLGLDLHRCADHTGPDRGTVRAEVALVQAVTRDLPGT